MIDDFAKDCGGEKWVDWVIGLFEGYSFDHLNTIQWGRAADWICWVDSGERRWMGWCECLGSGLRCCR